MGCVGVGVAIILWSWISPDRQDQRLKLAGFLGTVYAEGWPDRVDRLEYPPVKNQNQGAGEQPVYALLHPETPASQVEPEKKLPKPRPIRVVKKQAATGGHDKAGKVTKAAVPPSKKDKAAAKARAKKKTRISAAGGQKANSG